MINKTKYLTATTFLHARALALMLMFASAAGTAFAQVHLKQTVDKLIAASENRKCLLFTLQSVPIADASVTVTDPMGPAWFSIPVTQNGYHEHWDSLLGAKLTKTEIDIVTNGSMQCGFAEAIIVKLK